MSHDTVLHRLIRPGVRLLARTWVTPDQLTALRFLAGLGAAVAFASGQPEWLAIGAGIFVFSALLDRMDGELARQTQRFSQQGHRFDLIADWSAGLLAFVGLGIGAADGWLGWTGPALGIAAALGMTVVFWKLNAREPARLPNIAARTGRVLADPDDGIFLVPVLLFCFGPETVLLLAGTVLPLIALWMTMQSEQRAAARG